ncbi:hypothetical protein [Devosia aquimaris]|uniref:hypothetical protein n=1 Tax=Devosia aquimaris TaxID=2866214 RepID=UPI001CD0612E|nr:hypothetical protein [Devosia sp. CJK-A8-3]
MAKVERATARRGTPSGKVTLNGRAINIPDFDAVTFAKSLAKRSKPVTLQDREARLRAAEKKLGIG